MKKCGKCGNENADLNSVCSYCGGYLEENNNVNALNLNQNQSTLQTNLITNQNNNQTVISNVEVQNSTIKKSKKPFIIASIVVLVAIFIGISCFIVYKNYFKGKTRTVMIYMVGSNLESDHGCATDELNSINYNKMDHDNLKVVLIAGGTTKWKNDYIESEKTSIYELTENGYEVVKDQQKKDMGSSETLSDFLNYVYKNYKSDEYDLIFWDHGGALDGSEYDELSDNHLSLKVLNEALSNSPFNKKNKLETVLFSTCLNGMLEISNLFKDYSEYLIASEEVSYSFASTIDFINDITSKDTAVDFGEKCIKGYQQAYSEYKEKYEFYDFNNELDSIYVTYSLIDLSNIEKLINAINDFSSSIDVSRNYNFISKVRSNIYQYGNTYPEYDTIDLYTLVDRLKELSPNKAQEFFEAFNNAIVYNYATDNNSRGISAYFPYNGSSKIVNYFFSIYDDIEELENYKKFIIDFNNIKINNNYNTSYTKNSVSFDESGNNSSDFKLELTDDQVENFARAEYIVFRNDEENDGYYYPIYRGKEYELNGNILTANIKGKQLMVKSDDGTKWPITVIEDEITDKYINYNTLVTLGDYRDDDIHNWKIDGAKIFLTNDRINNQVYISSTVLTSENSLNDIKLPSKIAADYKNYQTITFATSKYKIFDNNGNYTEDWQSNGIIKGVEEKTETLDLEISDFDDNYTYYCVFVIFDTVNNYSYSNVLKMN